jgi:hypothetical protein
MKTAIEEQIRGVLAAHPKATNAEVARRLGLSPQRISQACKKHGIKLAKWQPPIQYTPRRYAAPPEVRAPILATGSVNHTICGAISELLVAADLMTRGFRVYTPIARQRSHDLIAVNAAGETLTIEVRSAKRKPDGKVAVTHKDKCASQFLAWVITGEPIRYRPDLPPAAHRGG